MTMAVAAGVAVLGAAVVGWMYLQGKKGEKREQAQAIERFRQQREHLEADALAALSRGDRKGTLTWVDCEFSDGFVLVRGKQEGKLYALVELLVRLRPGPASAAESLEEEDRVRLATCVFCYEGGHWKCAGRPLFNLRPSEAVAFFRDRWRQVAMQAPSPTQARQSV